MSPLPDRTPDLAEATAPVAAPLAAPPAAPMAAPVAVPMPIPDHAERGRALVEHASDLLMIVGPSGIIHWASPSVSTVLGLPSPTLVGVDLLTLVHGDDLPGAQDFLRQLAPVPAGAAGHAGGLTGTLTVATAKHEWRLRHATGAWLTFDTIGKNLLHEPGIGGLVLTMRDVTEQSALTKRYMHQAFHDPLTDLANRALFLHHVDHALARRARHGTAVTVLFLDLDHFKTVNDSLGHAAGDRLLTEAARRLTACVRACDLIARLGGDEFAVLIDDCPTVADVDLVARRVREALQRPFHLAGTEVFIDVSIGVALAQPGDAGDDLVRNADVAMYVAKTAGKGRHVLYEPAMRDAARARRVVEADLRTALEREEFQLQFQPIVHLETGGIVGAEALVRWTSPERGVVPPAAFIPITEETGLIVPIGRWVLHEACRTAQRWTVDHGRRIGLMVNLSARQLQDPVLVDDVRDALAASGLAPSQLTLEVTEGMLLQHLDVAVDRLTALKALGVGLALDDFGTGYSSLTTLQRYPIDLLKIDQGFVEVLDRAGDAPVLASAIIALADTLQMRAVAEGVESERQRQQLLRMGCEFGQGFHFSAPVDATQFTALLDPAGAGTASALGAPDWAILSLAT